MQRKAKKMKGEGMKNEQANEATREMRTKRETDPRVFELLFFSSLFFLLILKPRPCTIPPFFLFSAEQLLLAPGSGSADKMARCYCAK